MTEHITSGTDEVEAIPQTRVRVHVTFRGTQELYLDGEYDEEDARDEASWLIEPNSANDCSDLEVDVDDVELLA